LEYSEVEAWWLSEVEARWLSEVEARWLSEVEAKKNVPVVIRDINVRVL